MGWPDLIRSIVEAEGWAPAGVFRDPPPAPPGFTTQTREDGFLGIVTHYRFVRVKP